MLYVLIFLGLTFIGLGFILTEKNAPQLLSGYNTMSPEEREQYDLKGFLKFYKDFHIFLGVSTIVFGSLFHFFLSEKVNTYFISIYPILAYAYFIYQAQQFDKNEKNKGLNNFAIGLLIATAVGIVALSYYGYKPNELSLTEERIEISGMYGKKIPYEKITTVELVNELPKIKSRLNGFSSSTFKKGLFVTEEKEKIVLLVSDSQPPFLKINIADKKPIYFKSADDLNALKNQIEEKIKQ